MLIELRSGEGGQDAENFASELATAVLAYLRRLGTALQLHATGKTIVITTKTGVDPVLIQLSGTHRIQRIPGNDKSGRRHTSTASIVVTEAVNTPPSHW